MIDLSFRKKSESFTETGWSGSSSDKKTPNPGFLLDKEAEDDYRKGAMAVRRHSFKTQRRLGLELPGLGKSGALSRRPYPPGESGNKRKKYSDYALRLEEKQKLRLNYILTERQLRRFIRDSKTGQPANWVNSLAGRLERRLDNVVFRLGFAPSIPAARQLVSHGHILVDGKKSGYFLFCRKKRAGGVH